MCTKNNRCARVSGDDPCAVNYIVTDENGDKVNRTIRCPGKVSAVTLVGKELLEVACVEVGTPARIETLKTTRHTWNIEHGIWIDANGSEKKALQKDNKANL